MIEALSKTKFWESTAVFVLEDDAQNGPDHVDSHRSVLLVISPWARRGAHHRFVNTTDAHRDDGSAPRPRCAVAVRSLRASAARDLADDAGHASVHARWCHPRRSPIAIRAAEREQSNRGSSTCATRTWPRRMRSTGYSGTRSRDPGRSIQVRRECQPRSCCAAGRAVRCRTRRRAGACVPCRRLNAHASITRLPSPRMCA